MEFSLCCIKFSSSFWIRSSVNFLRNLFSAIMMIISITTPIQFRCFSVIISNILMASSFLADVAIAYAESLPVTAPTSPLINIGL